MLQPLDVLIPVDHSDDPIAAPLNLDPGGSEPFQPAPHHDHQESRVGPHIQSPTTLVQPVCTVAGTIAAIGSVQCVGPRAAFVAPFGDHAGAQPSVIGIIFTAVTGGAVVYFAQHESDSAPGSITYATPIAGVVYPVRRGWLRYDASAVGAGIVSSISWLVIASDIPNG